MYVCVLDWIGLLCDICVCVDMIIHLGFFFFGCFSFCVNIYSNVGGEEKI